MASPEHASVSIIAPGAGLSVDVEKPKNDAKKTKWYHKRAYVAIAVVFGAALIAGVLVVALYAGGLFGAGGSGKVNTGGSKGDHPDNNQTPGGDGAPSGAGEPTNTISTRTLTYSYSYPENVDEKSVFPVYDPVEKLLYTPWAEWKAKCGDGKCEEGEWCRTCPQDCNCTVNCGNGVCEDGENGDTCPDDCPYFISTCGNGKCERWGKHWEWQYENEINCPQDCPNSDVCGNGVCDKSESCFLCPQDCGQCAPICGDGRCNGREDCKTCAMDCGRCPIVDGDGFCDWPKESPKNSKDCTTRILSNNVTFEGVIYATIDNAPVPAGRPYNQDSCSDEFIAMPPGWRLAVPSKRTQRMLATGKFSFSTGCLVFEDGVRKPANPTYTKPEDCTDAPVTTKIENGIKYYKLDRDLCPSRILVQHIETSLEQLPANELLPCPFNCSNHGACDPFNGVCTCAGRWTGPGCERIIGDLQIPQSNKTWYKPERGIAWQWQLQGMVDKSFDVPLYDIDFDQSALTIGELHAQGRKVLCYFSAGSWEKFRHDEHLFPREGFGGPLSFGIGDTFNDEAWLDLRRMDLYLMLMLDRIDEAARKGCDGIEFDNPDGIIHDTKFKDGNTYTLNTQLVFNKWLAAQSHARGLAVALKNSNEFASYLADTYDMVVNEECWINGNCANYWPFLHRNKPVLNTEYFTALCMYCPEANRMNMSTIKKEPDLTPCRADCKGTWDNRPCEAAKFPQKPPNGDWCLMTKNDVKGECPARRFAPCDPMRPY